MEKESLLKKIAVKRNKEADKALRNEKKVFQPDIQVMMLGARRVGKTSILASMINQFNLVTKNTNLVLTKEKGKEIDAALNCMKGYFVGEPVPFGEVPNMDTNSTPGFSSFDLKLSIAGKKESRPRKIRFMDCSGEWITNHSNQDEVAAEVEKSDVIIIAIDSVLLMEEKGRYNHQNAVDNVTNFIKGNVTPDTNANGHKMVLFVPLKCEKYYWQNADKDGSHYRKRMQALNQAIKKAYEDLFIFFQKPNNKPYFDVAILPILTIGGIQFSEFTDKSKDSVLSEEMKYIYSRKPRFEPEYCEQPLIYTLLFEYRKIQREYNDKAYTKKNKKRTSMAIWEWIQDKRNLTKDRDYTSEMEKLEDYICINKEAGFEMIQGTSIR